MKIGLTGDTHGSMQNLRRVIAAAPPVEQWLHTGDYARDSLYLKSQTGLGGVRQLRRGRNGF